MLIIHAVKKIEHGKSISRRLRINNKFPGIVYGLDKPSIALELDHNIIFNLQKKIEFFQESLCLIVDNYDKNIVKVKSIQRHAFKLRLLHIDFIYI
ncbi:50S ribosomal protein L25 [Buchnera aphidicola]|uniref:50S ribosomal protein L25 n=1 Tax=Buchnera aphidicola TaxID=9 RepID=UPI003BEEFB41